MRPFDLEIVTPEHTIYSGKATKLFVPGVAGELEIRANHAPLLTAITAGPIWFENVDGDEEGLVMFGGMLEVQPDKTIILGDSALRSGELDEQRALAAKQQAEAIISSKDGDIDYAQAHSDLMVALAQLRILRRLRKG